MIMYRSFVSNSRASTRLSVQPTTDSVQFEKPTETINTGYSTFSVPSGVFSHMDSRDTSLTLRGGDHFEVILPEVHFERDFSTDGNYSFFHQAMQEYPVTVARVFAMNNAEFTRHITLIMAKYSSSGEGGIAFFETNQTKGIIRLGSGPHSAGIIYLNVWDKQRPLCQEMCIKVSDPTLRNDTARAIASSYVFTIDALPDRDKLIQMSKYAAEAFSNRAGEQVAEPELPKTGF